MARNIVNVLDLGSCNIKALVAERRPGEKTLRILGAGLVRSEGIRKGLVSNAEILGERIKEVARIAERTSGIPFRHAYVVFGSTALSFQKSRGRIMISRADGEISAYDVERVIKQTRPQSVNSSNREIIETFGINFLVDGEFQSKDPVGIKGENLEAEVLFITCLSKPLAELIEAVEKSGLAIDDVLVSPLASGRALLSERQREVGAMVLDIGAETSTLAVFEEGSPYSLAVFPIGSNHITNDIALGFQVSLDVAEEIKLGAHMPDDSKDAKRKLSNIIEARLEDLFELVEGHLKKIGRAGLLPGGVVVSGGGSRLEGISEFTKAALRLPASIGRSSELEVNHKISDPIWAAALGGILLALGEDVSSSSALKRPSALGAKLSSWLKSLIP